MSVTLIDKITTDGGFTYDPRTGELIGTGSGYVIAVPGTERILGPAELDRETFAARFADLVQDYGTELASGAYVGGWLSERGYMIELSEVYRGTRTAAIALGTARNQEAIYALDTGECIPCGGTGG